MTLSDRLRALAKRTALDGIAEELLAIADNELDDFTEADRFRCERSKELRAQMEAAGDFETEEFGFAQELVEQYGGDKIDDNAEVYKIHVKDLYVIMKMLGYSRAPVAAESLSYGDLVKVEDGKVSKVTPQADPANPGWCIGCNPDNCMGCGIGLNEPQQATSEPVCTVCNGSGDGLLVTSEPTMCDACSGSGAAAFFSDTHHHANADGYAQFAKVLMDEVVQQGLLEDEQQATPERHLTVTTNQQGDAVMVSWQDDEHRILEVVWERDQTAQQAAGEPVPSSVEAALRHYAEKNIEWVTFAKGEREAKLARLQSSDDWQRIDDDGRGHEQFVVTTAKAEAALQDLIEWQGRNATHPAPGVPVHVGWAYVSPIGLLQVSEAEAKTRNDVEKIWVFREGAPGVPALSKDQIREVFLAHGFTIREGQTDLKPYVFEAAEALLKLAGTAPAVPEGFALVPVEPTPEMIRCAEMWDDGFEGAYARALAAAQANGEQA